MAALSEQSSGAANSPWRPVKETATKIVSRTSEIIWTGVFGPVLSSLKHRYQRLNMQRQLSKRKEERKRQLPEAVPSYRPRPLTPRPRALTTPLEHGTRQESLDQMQSRFFRLPVELRLIIYKEALRGHTCHIMSDDNNKLCSESIDVLYEFNTFCFRDPVTFVALSRTLPPQRLNLIASLQLFYPIRRSLASKAPQYGTWQTLAGMKGLRVLRVLIEDDGCLDGYPLNLYGQMMVMEPLKAIRGVDSFEVAWCQGPGLYEGLPKLTLFRFECDEFALQIPSDTPTRHLR